MGINQIGNVSKNQAELWMFGLPDYTTLHEKTERRRLVMQRKELPKIDFTKYIGAKAKTDSADIINTKFGIAIRVSATIDKENDVKANTLLSPILDKETGKYVIGVGTKFDDFLTKKGVDPADIGDELVEGGVVGALIGLDVVAQMGKNDFLYLV